MRNLKKFLALVLAMMMALSLMVTANAQNPKKDYDDLGEATFTEAIDVLTGMGVLKGNDGNFGPERPITRAEAVAVLYRLVTGDVTDSQAELYAPAAAYFTDVAPNAWYAGYVGFAVDAGYIKGFDGAFNPTGNVTGYEMLAMLLRAVGYGKNGEFTGSQWMINVGATAQSLGILAPIESTDFANTLAKASPREVVAELTFVTASEVPTVRYEYGYYNQYTGVVISGADSELNPTLGEKVFGLTDYTGIIVGNQETGERSTIIAVTGNTIKFKDGGTAKEYKVASKYAYSYPGTSVKSDAATGDVTEGNGKDSVDGDDVVTTGLNLNIKTGLNLYGHKVKAWYKAGSSTTYAVIDLAKSATVYATDGTLALADIADAADMDIEAQVQISLEYSQFGAVAGNGNMTNQSTIKMYTVIDNDGDDEADAIIRLNAEVAKVLETNTTRVPQTIKLGGVGTSKFESRDPDDQAQYLTVSGATTNQVIGEFDIKTALGKIFTVWQVKGSKAAYSMAAPDFDGDDYAVLKTPLETKTGTVATYTKDGSDLASVTLVGGETIKVSGILQGGQDVAYNSTTGIAANSIQAGVNYTFVVDELGRFLDISAPNGWSFLYATYADFQYGNLGSGDIKYWMYGIDWEGKNVNDKALTWMRLGDDLKVYGEGAGDTKTLGVGYASEDFDVTKKDMATNSVMPGVNIGVMMTENGAMTLAEGDESLGIGLLDTTPWNISRQDAANGFAKVSSNGTDYMLTNDTLFYVVTGFGTGATVKTYKGISELVGSGTSASITYTTDGDEVWFKTGAYTFDSITTTRNNTITTVILSASNLKGFSNQNLYFSAPYNTQSTGVKLAGKSAEQWTLWLNGVKGTYFISEVKDGSDLTTDLSGASNGKFFTLSLDETYMGVPIYKAEVVGTSAGDDPRQGVPGDGGVCNVNLTYSYVMVNDYNKANIGGSGGSGGLTMNVDGAVVADVQYANPAFDTDTRVEIDTLQKLNNAVSIYNGNDKVKVAIVNNGINVTTIYVVGVDMT